jgi:hypothetical protein
VNPGATAAQTRWRVGGWMVGSGVLGPAVFVVLLGGASIQVVLLGIAWAAFGACIANPFRTIERLRVHGRMDPVVRLKPLGLVSYTGFFLAFVLPFAVGEWLLRLVGEWHLRRPSPVEPEPVEEDTWHGEGPVVWLPDKQRRWRF